MSKKFKIYVLTISLTSLLCLPYPELQTGSRDIPATIIATNSKPISQTSITDQNSTTLPNGIPHVIDKPGQYYLTGPLIYSPKNPGDIIISIEANDVVLDLASYTISADPTEFLDVTCINIADNKHNIHILNGRLNQVTGVGINISPNCSSIYISDVIIRNCNLGGILANLARNIFLDNVNIANCNGDGTSAGTGEAVGMLLIDVTFLSANNCTFNSCTSALHDGTGVKLVSNVLFCNDCNFKNCTACHNGTSDGAHNAYGFRLENTRTCTFKDCTATDNGLANGNLNSYGFVFANGHNNMCYNCLATSNKITQTNGATYGFYLTGATNHYFENCEARNQDASEAASGSAYGFYASAGTGNTFYKCKSHGNCAGYIVLSRGGPSSNPIAAGFAIENDETRSSIEACDASANNGNAGEAYGIKLGQVSGDNPTFCFINNNRLMNNFGPIAQYGLKDFSPNSLNLITRNQAFAQGPVFRSNPTCTDTGFMNFMISYADPENNKINNILVEGDRAELKVFSTAAPLDNLSIFYSEDISGSV